MFTERLLWFTILLRDDIIDHFLDIYEKLFYGMITNMWNVHYVYLIII